MNINKNTIIKNISAILCVIAIIGLIFTFASVKIKMEVDTGGMADASSESSFSASGFEMVTGSGVWGWLIPVGMVVVLASNYLEQLADYKKLLSLAGSALSLVATFLAAGTWSTMQASASGGGASVDITTSYGAGFYIVLIATILLTAVALIGFLNLKGNPLFDAINGESDDSESKSAPAMPNVNFGAMGEKISGAAKSVANAVKKDNTQEAAAPATEAEAPAAAPAAPTAEDNTDAVMEKINKLFALKEKGILTEEEFAKQKAALLEQL